MKTFEEKYKDLSPLQTVQNIQNYFKEKNLTLEEYSLFQSGESGVWSCAINLKSQNIPIISSNGKGSSLEYALASGYAEAYERFNNKAFLHVHPIVNHFLMEQNKDKNNYYLDKEEKIKTLNDLNKEKILYNNYISYLGNNKNFKYFLNLFCNNQIIEIPYKNCFNDNDIVYEDPRLWQKINGSSGMAAGNTVEEALVQGISEVFEHYVQEQFFKNPPKTLFFIKEEDINEKNLEIINKIKIFSKKEVKIFDLSYNYNVPVCLVVLYNSNSYNYLINFSSAPTIQIAIERALTELYQNQFDYNNVNIEPQTPCNNLYAEILSEFYTQFSKCNHFPEKALINSQSNNYNKEIFLKDELYNNNQFLKHYEKICKELNLKLYYYLYDKSDNIKAVSIISPYFNYKNYIYDYFKDITTIKKNKLIIFSSYIYNFVLDILSNNISLNKIKKYRFIFNKIHKLKNKEQKFISFILGANWLTPFFTHESITILFEMSKREISKDYILYAAKGTQFEFSARKYISLYEYKKSKKYTDKEIYDFFINLDNNLTIEEIKLCDNLNFLFYKIIVETIKNTYSSEAFINMINAYCD